MATFMQAIGGFVSLFRSQNPQVQTSNTAHASTIFALVIGINDYAQKKDFSSLRGAVNDARAFKKYLKDVHYVPDDNIVHLENRKATRAAILSAFKSHFLNNEQIRDDGEAIIIFFFSGHGSRVEATGDRIATDGKVEVICPVDERTTKESYGIPDYTLGRLFQKVADLKKPLNITVILDSCHSGGIGRAPGDAEIRCPPTYSFAIPPELDSDLWKRKTDEAGEADETVQSCHLWTRSATSHVLMAACREDEEARENQYDGEFRGWFTKRLIECLQTTDLKRTTYEELLDQMRVVGVLQNPHCGGAKRHGLLFTGKYPATGPNAVTLTPYRDPDPDRSTHDANTELKFVVRMGTMDGVVPYTVDGIFRRGGTVFSAYDADNSFLCTLVAQSVGLEQTIVVPVEKEKPVHGSPTEQPRVIIPPGSRAVVLDWNNDCMILLVHVPAADSLHTGTLFSSNLRRRFRKETLETLAHLIVRSDGKQIVLEPRESMMHCQMKLFDGDIKHLPDVIDGIAHFNYFLNRSNETSRLKGSFSLEMHRLKGDHPQREPDSNFGQDGNLVKDGEVRVASQKGANYGFTICNTSGEDLFPYLFYFDPDEYTIKLFYGPPGRNVAPPLTATKRTLTIGMGRELAFNFALDPERPSPALFKLFVTNVYVELEWIEQTLSPLNPGFRKAPTPRREQLPPTWDALTVIFRMY